MVQLMPLYPVTLEPFAGKLTESSAHSIFRSLRDSLNFLHKVGYCHADIKPSNIALSDSGQAVLIDTGSLVRTGRTLKSGTYTTVFVPYDLETKLKGESTNIHNVPAVFDWWMLATTFRSLLVPGRDDGTQPSSMAIVKSELSTNSLTRGFWSELSPLLQIPDFKECLPSDVAPANPVAAPVLLDFSNVPLQFQHSHKRRPLLKSLADHRRNDK